MNDARTIITALGGIRKTAGAIASALGREAYPASTVQYWWSTNSIPFNRIADVVAAAHAHGLPVTRDGLIEALEARRTDAA